MRFIVLFFIGLHLVTLSIFYFIFSNKVFHISNVAETGNICHQIKLKTLDDAIAAEITPEDEVITDEDKQILEVINRNKLGNTTIISISNIGFANMTLNWILSLKKTNFLKFVVLSFDQELIDFLSAKGYQNQVALIPRTWHEQEVGKGAGDVGSKTYLAVGNSKSYICFKLLSLGQEFIFSDVDTVWLNDKVIDYVKLARRTNDAHLLYSQEYTTANVVINIGFFYALPTTFSKRVYKELLDEQKKNSKISDQACLYRILERNKYNDKRVDMLDHLLISSGPFFFKEKLHLKFNISPMVVHTTYFLTLADKMNAFKENKFWYIE